MVHVVTLHTRSAHVRGGGARDIMLESLLHVAVGCTMKFDGQTTNRYRAHRGVRVRACAPVHFDTQANKPKAPTMIA